MREVFPFSNAELAKVTRDVLAHDTEEKIVHDRLDDDRVFLDRSNFW